MLRHLRRLGSVGLRRDRGVYVLNIGRATWVRDTAPEVISAAYADRRFLQRPITHISGGDVQHWYRATSYWQGIAEAAQGALVEVHDALVVRHDLPRLTAVSREVLREDPATAVVGIIQRIHELQSRAEPEISIEEER